MAALSLGFLGGKLLGTETEATKVTATTIKASDDLVKATDAPQVVYEESLPGDVYEPPQAPSVEVPEQAIIPDETTQQPPEAPQSIAELVEKVETQEAIPVWLQFAANGPVNLGNKPLIAIVIDDLGVDQKRSARMIDMIAPLTLSFLPYAKNLPAITGRASRLGHELMVHISMEPKSSKADPGPNALLVGLDERAIRSRVDWALAQFDGYVGINNHMGSKFTEDKAGMSVVISELKSRELLFLDSRTTNKSVGGSLAAKAGVPHISRNIFLDHKNTVEAINKQLKILEKFAKRNGWAVGIGHPREPTLKALGAWLPQLEKKGFILVPLTTLVKKRYKIG
ncbi:MAG: divergent polysaccharide deacetylase family protein [Alphaproteobacteria bacterium]|nr:divergent polysaccharide deacetylase family protein [Alphaproteobacteria bacterium]